MKRINITESDKQRKSIRKSASYENGCYTKSAKGCRGLPLFSRWIYRTGRKSAICHPLRCNKDH